jgi:peptide/nickel transport system permease protein
MPGDGAATAPVAPAARRRRGGVPRSRVRDYAALGGGLFLLLVVLTGAFAPFLTPYDPVALDTPNRLRGPSLAHPLGTDEFGRDVFARLLYGSRTTLLVGLVSVAVALLTGTTLGTLAGYYGGVLEAVIMRAMDAMLSLPLILLAIMIVVVLGSGVLNLIVAIGISQVPPFTRLARALVLSVRTREFVQAARGLGAANTRILRVHVVPNVTAPLVVQAVATVALAILNAAALNFLGLGIQPPSPDWGAMIADFRRFVFDRPELPLYPGAAIALTVLAVNLLGDGLVGLADPTARRAAHGT